MKPVSDETKANPLDWQALGDWYATPLGQYLLAEEQAVIDELLQRRFGYQLLQLGCSELILHDKSPMGHRFSFCPHPEIGTRHTAVANGAAIPLAAESVDLVLMHHALDFSRQQHQLLREVARILIAGGQVVIVGFNPWSSWGLRSRLSRRRKAPFNALALSPSRVTDWLALLDFQVVSVRYGGYTLPVNSSRWIRFSSWMGKLAAKLNWPAGGNYSILARKQVMPLTPVHKHWRRLSMPVVGLPVSAERNKR